MRQFSTASLWGTLLLSAVCSGQGRGDEKPAASPTRTYLNTLTKLENPQPIFADYPQFVQPVIESVRYEAPILVDDPEADLEVRAWRFSYNARGIVEIPNRLKAADTAIVMVHPWGIDDGSGWRTPEPNGCADFCTLEKNHLAAEHTKKVVDPFHKSLRGKVSLVMYSLPGKEDPIRKKLYRSVRGKPTDQERVEGAKELDEKLNSFDYSGEPLVKEIQLTEESTVKDYFKQFPGLDATAKYNHEGFWQLPIPVTRDIDVHPDDVVIYDAEGYEILRDFLKSQKIRHVLLTGYATDMCYCRTTAGYENLSKDFNVFLVGDASLATFPANNTPQYATNAHLSFASLTQLVTQVSWIKYNPVSQQAAKE